MSDKKMRVEKKEKQREPYVHPPPMPPVVIRRMIESIERVATGSNKKKTGKSGNRHLGDKSPTPSTSLGLPAKIPTSTITSSASSSTVTPSAQVNDLQNTPSTSSTTITTTNPQNTPSMSTSSSSTKVTDPKNTGPSECAPRWACRACHVEEMDTAYIPCGHIMFCFTCASSRLGECSKCLAPVTGVVKILPPSPYK